MTDTVPTSWRAALDPVLATVEARQLGDWLRANYHYGATDYRVFDQYRFDYGPLIVWIGFAAGWAYWFHDG